MNGSDPAFVEAARLVREFFPESKAFITSDIGLDWDAFLGGGFVPRCSEKPFAPMGLLRPCTR